MIVPQLGHSSSSSSRSNPHSGQRAVADPRLRILAARIKQLFSVFKQKTAYDIDCDWSSDVCSSDLKYGIPAIATGDILRAQVASGTPLGKRVKAYLDRGELVPDGLVVDLIQHRLLDPDTQQGFILDGFPRTVPQSQALDSMLTALDRPLDAVLYLQLEPQAVKERLGQRHRSDDLEGIVDHRLDVFLDRTAPLIRYYNDQGKLKVI